MGRPGGDRLSFETAELPRPIPVGSISLAPLSTPARDFKQNRNHIRGKALRFVGGFCRAVGSPGEKKSSGQAQDSLSAPLSCPKFTGNLREQQLSAIISCIPEGWSAHRIKMPPTSGTVAGLRPNNHGAMRRQGESA
jgi:hypothetical protein